MSSSSTSKKSKKSKNKAARQTPLQYLLCVFLTLLLCFAYIGSVGTILLQTVALREKTCEKLVEENHLAETVHNSLTAYYQEQENATGIPADVYAESITAERLSPIIHEKLVNGFAYLHGKANAVGYTPDFSQLEQDLTEFFENYAEENGYQKDEAYEKALDDAILAAKTNIQTNTDVFRFATLDDAGVMSKAKRVVSLLDEAMILCLGLTVILVLLLWLVQRRDPSQILYWFSAAVAVGSLLCMVPACWLQATRWFDRFAVKTDQIFIAVTSYLYTLTQTVIVTAVIGLLVAAIGFLVFGLLRHRRNRNQSEKKKDNTKKAKETQENPA